MPQAKKPKSGLIDTWGRLNRRLADKVCEACGAMFRPKRSAARFCSKRCLWSQNGGQNKKAETWWINAKGYIEGKIWLDGHTQIRVKKHRWIMEQHLGRKLLASEDVHHKDENKQNNEINNLEIISHSEHTKHHHTGRKNTMESKMKMRKSALNRAAIAKAKGE